MKVPSLKDFQRTKRRVAARRRRSERKRFRRSLRRKTKDEREFAGSNGRVKSRRDVESRSKSRRQNAENAVKRFRREVEKGAKRLVEVAAAPVFNGRNAGRRIRAGRFDQRRFRLFRSRNGREFGRDGTVGRGSESRSVDAGDRDLLRRDRGKSRRVEGRALEREVFVPDLNDGEDRAAVLRFGDRVGSGRELGVDDRVDAADEREVLELRRREENDLRNEVAALDLVEVVIGKLDRDRVVIEVSLRARRNGVDRQRRVERQIRAVRDVRQLQAVAASRREVLETRADERRGGEIADGDDVPINVHPVGALEENLGDFRLTRLRDDGGLQRRDRSRSRGRRRGTTDKTAAERTRSASDDDGKRQ